MSKDTTQIRNAVYAFLGACKESGFDGHEVRQVLAEAMEWPKAKEIIDRPPPANNQSRIHGHLPYCNYWTKPIGFPGCMCRVIDKNLYKKLMELADELLTKYDARFRGRKNEECKVGPLFFDAVAPPEVIKWLSEHPPTNMIVLQPL